MNKLTCVLLGTAALVALSAQAGPPGPDNINVISGNVLENGKGIIGINMVAGSGNAQLNAGALAVSVGQGAHSSLTLSQTVDVNGYDRSGAAVSTISANAFGQAAGLISINQASGQGNAQINGFSIGLGLGGGFVVDESSLAATVTGNTVEGDAQVPQGYREARIEGEALGRASGLVQINQLAGSGNATANSFKLNISVSSPSNN